MIDSIYMCRREKLWGLLAYTHLTIYKMGPLYLFGICLRYNALLLIQHITFIIIIFTGTTFTTHFVKYIFLQYMSFCVLFGSHNNRWNSIKTVSHNSHYLYALSLHPYWIATLYSLNIIYLIIIQNKLFFI